MCAYMGFSVIFSCRKSSLKCPPTPLTFIIIVSGQLAEWPAVMLGDLNMAKVFLKNHLMTDVHALETGKAVCARKGIVSEISY